MFATTTHKVRAFVLSPPFLLSLLLFWSLAAVVSHRQSTQSAELQLLISRLEEDVKQMEVSIQTRAEYKAPFNRIAHSHASPAAFRFYINEMLHSSVRQHSVTGESQYTLDGRYLLRTDPYAGGHRDEPSARVPFQVTEATIDLQLESQDQIFTILQDLVSLNEALANIESCVVKEPDLSLIHI